MGVSVCGCGQFFNFRKISKSPLRGGSQGNVVGGGSEAPCQGCQGWGNVHRARDLERNSQVEWTRSEARGLGLVGRIRTPSEVAMFCGYCRKILLGIKVWQTGNSRLQN